MQRKLSRLLVVGVALSMLTFGFTLTAGAHHDDPDKTDKNDQYNGDITETVTYVNTDNGFVACLGEEVSTPDGVILYNPLATSSNPDEKPSDDEAELIDTRDFVGDQGVTQSIREPKHDHGVCFGGAIITFAGDDIDDTGGELWKLWAQEEVHHQAGGESCVDGTPNPLNGDKVSCPSGFAQIRSTYTYETDQSKITPPNCNPGDDVGDRTYTQVCQGDPTSPSDTTSISWVTHKTAICNDLEITTDGSVLGHDDAEAALGDSWNSGHTFDQAEHTVLYFLSGPDFVLDCFNDPVGATDTIKDTYRNTVVPTLNSVTCSEPGDVGEDLPNLICFLDPFGETSCPDRIGTVGTVGTITTSFNGDSNPGFCQEALDHDDARILQGTQSGLFVKNFPVEIV